MLNPFDTYFWTTIALLSFFILLLYFKVPSLIAKSLDERSNAIRKELEDARKLREEAQKLVADYKQRSQNAEAIAKEIVAQAEKEAKIATAEARRALREELDRRSKSLEEKILRAERQAIEEVRSFAVDVALDAVEKIVQTKLTEQEAKNLIDSGLQELKQRLN